VPAASAWADGVLDSRHAELYAELVQQTQRRPLSLGSIRIPGRRQYLAALDDAVHEAVRGNCLPLDCLLAAAERWREITSELGVEMQRDAHWRSLGEEP
jgi:hypothetical protein